MRPKTRSLILLALSGFILSGCTLRPAGDDTAAPAPVTQAAACQVKPDAGMCRAAFTRYYFDSASGTCRSFIWGGCGGSVPFETMQACQEACGAPASDMPPVAPVKQSLSF